MNTYARLPVAFTHGEGVYLWDNNGKQYMDAISGIAVCGLGHAHPDITAAIQSQASKLLHTSNLYEIPLQEQLAEKLTEKTGLTNVFFSNSGAEANEAAIKLARLYGHHHEIRNPCIIVMENSFHGRTLATLSATGNRKVQSGFEPLVQGFLRAPYNDIEALHNIAGKQKEVVAIMAEPIQGEGGVNIPDEGYLAAIRDLCDQKGWLMILDEIQTGMCRTGKWFAYEHENIQPDILTSAKALGNGIPIGACLAGEKVAQTFKPGNHGSTFGGNPFACSAAIAVIDAMDKHAICNQSAETGAYLLEQFRKTLLDHPGIIDIRGKGMMLGIELDRNCQSLVGEALNSGLLINVTAEKVVRLLPPLILNKDQADQLVEKLSGLIKQFLTSQAA